MHRRRTDRRRQAPLLARPPCGQREVTSGWTALIIDPIDQLQQLADLHRRGLLTREEFERQKARVWATG